MSGSSLPDNNPMREPEIMAQSRGIPLVTALIDFDIRSPERMVIAGNPVDLSLIPHLPVTSIFTEALMVTIAAHEDEGQEVADMLQAKPELKYWALKQLDCNVNYSRRKYTNVSESRSQQAPKPDKTMNRV